MTLKHLVLPLACLLAGCAGAIPSSPVDIVGEALVALPPDAVRPLVAAELASYPTRMDGVGDTGPGGDATRYTVVTTPFGDGGTRVRIARRALPQTTTPTPGAVLSGLRTRLEDQAVRVETAAVWTDSLSLADGLCAPDGQDLFKPAARPEDVDMEQVSPTLIGGIAGLSERIVYPRLMRNAGIQGRVLLRFTVEPDGSVGCLQAVESPPVMLTEAAGRAVRASRFTPGLSEGEPVRVQFQLPLQFVLN